MQDKNVIVLQERYNSCDNLVNEAVEAIGKDGEKKKHWHLKGIFMQAERENLNGRIYPLSEMEREVAKLQDQIKLNGSVAGELDHPEDLVVSCQTISHVIEEIHMDGNDAKGDMRIIDTVPAGKLVVGLMEGEVPIGVSSRGTGVVDEYTSEVSDFNLVTIDIVATPSAQGAKPNAIFENLRNGAGLQLLKNAENCIRNGHAHTQEFNNDVISWFKNWKIN